MPSRTGKHRIIPYLLALFCVSQVHASRWDAYQMWNAMACEDQELSLKCPGNDVIKIITAEYGRQSAETCSALPSQMKNTNCALPNAHDILEQQCNNKTTCELTVSNDIFPDPCPGTHKYLRTVYNCVKYMFGCPGFLVGIGTEDVANVNIQPQAGTWVKDPLYNTDRVFFNAQGSQTVHEYVNWADFIAGNPKLSYTLPSDITGGNMVVYDRNLYYIKIKSNPEVPTQTDMSIIKYNLITRFRVKETRLWRRANRGLTDVRRFASLSADEDGLWVAYTAEDRNVMIVSKLDKDMLIVEEKWTTTYNPQSALQTFTICGVLYVVSSATGRVDYYYNTNVKRNVEKRRPSIAFDDDRLGGFAYMGSRRAAARGRSRSTGRTFLRHNASSMSYNPRDRLLYVWDQSSAKAVVYKLHFGEDPTKADVVVTSTTTTTTRATTRRTTEPTTKRPMIPEVPPADVDYTPKPDSSPYYCLPEIRGNINWPKTKIGETAKMACPKDPGAIATYDCVQDSSKPEATWHVVGPDLSKCNTVLTNLETMLDAGLIGRAEASERLLEDMDSQLTDKAIELTSQLVKKLVDAPSLPNRYEAERIVESLTAVSNKLLGTENAAAWESMEDEKRAAVANTLMNSVEKAGFLYADAMAAMRAEDRDNEPLVVASDGVIMQVEVREKTLSTPTNSATTFPSEKTRAENPAWNDVADVIEIPDFAIMTQKGEGPATVVFALYNNLGDFLSTPPPSVAGPVPAGMKNDNPNRDIWEIDSRIISASFRGASYHAQLSSPAVILLEHKKESRHPHRCVYWDYSESSRTGNWSDEGCRRVEGNSTHTRCECDHLTSFAVLVDHAGVTMREVDDATLDIITSVGISISIVCLLICIFTFSCFRNLYSDRNTIHKHLCICLLVAEAIFLIGINQTQHEIACAVIAGLLHYSFLAAFLWMALEGFQLYVMLVEVFEGNSRWKWYYLTGYGIPAVIVGVSAGIDHTGYGTDEVCWLRVDSGFIWSFVGPVCVVILANLVFLSITVYKMYVHTMTFSDSSKINSIKAAMRGASVLLCLLGITWAFGILWISEHMTVLAYLFCIFNAFQGMFIFVFHCLLPKKVRHEYSRCFGRLPCCESISRDTYVSNSMSFSKQYTPGRYANGASGGTHQASLSRQSQLRRMWNETVAPNTPDAGPISSEVTQARVTLSLSRELSKMRSVALRDGYNTTSSILYFYPVDKPKRSATRHPLMGGTEPRPKRQRPSIITSYCKRNTMVVADKSRSGSCQHRVTSQVPLNAANDQHHQGQHESSGVPPILPARQQQLRQEDDVFLPPDHVPEPRPAPMSRSEPENVALLPNKMSEDIQYDHLQHHRHHDHFHHMPPFDADHYPPGYYHHGGGKAPPASRHHFAATVSHSGGVHSHAHAPHFNSASYSQSRMQDIMDDPSLDPRHGDRRFEGGHLTAPHWSDSPVGHHYQSSFEDNVSNAKRDSGISMQHPQNHLAQEAPRNKNRRSLDNDGMQPDSDGSNRIMPTAARRCSNQGRAQDTCDDTHLPPHQRIQRHGEFPSDEREVYNKREEQRVGKANTMAGRLGPHCPNHHPMLVPLSERQAKGVTMGNRRRKSLSSDSDDPIVTDCSVSSTGSSFGNPLASLSRVHNVQDNITEEPYYDEQSYHKRRLPNPAQSANNHREPWYPNKMDGQPENGDANGDENDLEVEMITAPNGAVENSRAPSSIASYHHQRGSGSPHSGATHSPDVGTREERYISPPAGYRSGAGKLYAPAGGTVDKYRQPNAGYHGRNADSRGSPMGHEYGQGYRYLPNNGVDGRGEDIDSNGGLRMMTNL